MPGCLISIWRSCTNRMLSWEIKKSPVININDGRFLLDINLLLRFISRSTQVKPQRQ
jgi:hypothetical protein